MNNTIALLLLVILITVIEYIKYDDNSTKQTSTSPDINHLEN